MEKRLAVVLNQFGQHSEVFLLQLFKSLSSFGEIRLYVIGNVDKYNPWYKEFKVLKLPKPFSFKFALHALRKINQGIKDDALQKKYYEYLLDYITEPNIYFPFISMTRSFADAIIKNNSKRIFCSVRGTDITVTPYLNPNVIEVYKKYADKIYKVHFLSEELMDRTMSYGLFYQNSDIIYQGINIDLFKPKKSLTLDKLRILTVGRLHYIKGLEFAVLMAAELKKRGLSFEMNIIGDGPEKEKLIYLIHDLNLQNSVFLRGAKGRQEIVEYFHKSNVYIHTHLVSGLSNTMLEALASGLRVVTFESNLKSYSFIDFTGIINEIPRYDHIKLANSLEEIWRSKSLGLLPAEASILLSHFSLEKQTKNFIKFFEWE